MAAKSPFARMDNLSDLSDNEEDDVQHQNEAVKDTDLQTTEKQKPVDEVSKPITSNSNPPPRPKRSKGKKKNNESQETTTEEANEDPSPKSSSFNEKHVSFAKEPVIDEENEDPIPETNEADDFWASHFAWKERVEKDKFFVNPHVCEPESGARSIVALNPTVFYKVKIADIDGFVKRRYSDFEWLQELLQSRFVGMVVPPLPPKIVGSGEQFLKLRMKGLSMFLQKIVANPYLKSDHSVYSFLTETNSEQWENIKKQSTAFESHRDNTGHEKWLQALSKYELPSDSKTVLFELNRQVENLSRQLGKLLASATNLSAGSQQITLSVIDFDHKFQDLLISEMISTSTDQENKLETDDENEDQDLNDSSGRDARRLINSIRNLSFTARNWSENVDEFSQIVDFFILEAIRFEFGLVSRLQDLLKRRKEVIKLHDKSVQKKIIHEREKKVAEHSQQLEQMNKLSRKIAEDEERVRNTYDHAIFITKGLFFSGARHFAKVKGKRLEKLKDTLCAAFKMYHEKMAKVWENQIGDLSATMSELNFTETDEDTKDF